ncbi:class I SAM-dependent methyltransferase [Candidatus Woesearchaeota archaeon]|nr:class I SAM-dependent methyltransferase [Candidatus Woesearchaeota archaeon]
MECRVCGTATRMFLSLGETALANSYLSANEVERREMKFPLELSFCEKCKVVQLNHTVPPELLFKHYLYVTSTSNTFRQHFAQYAESIAKEFNLGKSSLAVDIGSNDGLLLKGFQKFGVKVVGIEPAANVAKIAADDGVETVNDFFNENVAKQIVAAKGHADVVTANNVFAHTDTIKDIAKNVKTLLKEDGIFVVEAAYLVDMLKDMTFDAVYHEHLFYYSLTALDYFFKNNGMQIFKVQHVPSHGGSLRVFVKKQESGREVDSSVAEMLDSEKGVVDNFETYRTFAAKVHDNRKKLVKLLAGIKSQGRSIAAYGAPAKATTLLSFCGIGKETIDYVVDDSPLKQGLFMPGSHIPIVSSAHLDSNQPDYILILAWNFAGEILKNTKKYADAGVKFIVPVPEPMVR